MSMMEPEDIAKWQEIQEFIDNNPMLKTTIAYDLYEWSKLISELSEKEISLYKQKEVYNALSDKIIKETDFKELYGKNNAEVRKTHVKNELMDMHKTIKDLEFSIDYIVRRISYLKSLIRTKSIVMEARE